MPPRRRPPRQIPRSVVYRRRLVAVAVLVAGFLIAWFAYAFASTGGGKTTTQRRTPSPPPPFRVIFPEGFTREQMAGRVDAVAKIAQHERGKNERGKRPKLAASSYLAWSSARGE